METRLNEAEQLKLLETAVAQAKEAVLITSARLDLPGPEILFVNPAFTEMTGYSQGEILLKTPRILQGPKSDRAMLQRLRAALSRGQPFSGETVNYRKDGSEYYVEWDITPVRAGGGQISHFLSIQRNVTARKLAESQLKEMFRQVEKSRNDLCSILNELRIGATMTDEHNRVVFLNSTAQQLFAKPHTDVIEGTWNEVFDLDADDGVKLQLLIDKPAEERARMPVHLDRGMAVASGSKWTLKTIPGMCAVKFSFFTTSQKFMTCAVFSTSGRAFTISWARAKLCNSSTNRSVTSRGSIQQC